MNKKIIALGMAGAMAIAAVFTTAVPVSAQVITTVSYDGLGYLDFEHLVGESDPYHADDTSETIGIGESRTAIVYGTVETTTRDTINTDTKYINSDLDVMSTNGITTTVKHLSLADCKDWTSSNPAVATVANGVVTGVSSSNGNYVTISAKFDWTDQNGTVNTETIYGYVKVAKTPVNDYLIPEDIDLAVGETYTIAPPPATRKGTPLDQTYVEFDDDDFTQQYFGVDAKWDDAGNVYSGPRASFDKKAKTLTAKETGHVLVWAEFKSTTDGSIYWKIYNFYIKDAVGTVVPDDYGEANYKILNAHEVAYAGMVKATNKPVIPSTVRIKNVVYDVVEIADGAFKGKSIVSVTMPKQTKKIGASAFENCKKLTSLDISETDVEQIGAAAFAGCVKCKELTVNGDKVKTYGAGAFKKFKKKNVINVEASSKKVFKSASKKIKKAGGKKAKIVEQD